MIVNPHLVQLKPSWQFENCYGGTLSNSSGQFLDGSLQENYLPLQNRYGPLHFFSLKQVHGTKIHTISDLNATFTRLGDGDGLFTDLAHTCLSIRTADCLAISLVGTRGAALLHAGWRGLLGGILQKGIEKVGIPRFAFFSAHIHQDCFEVGDEVVQEFEKLAEFCLNQHLIRKNGRAYISLGNLARSILSPWPVVFQEDTRCTFKDPGLPSYRRDKSPGRLGHILIYRNSYDF